MSETQTTLRETLESAYNEHVEPSGTAVTEAVPAEAKPAPTQVEQTAKALKEDKTGRLHDEVGKFAPKEAKETKAPAAAEPAAEVVARPPRPSSWKKDYEKDWETLDPKLAAYINQREQEYAKGVSTYKQEWDRAKPLLDAISPYQQMLQQHNVRPEQIVQNLFQRHQQLTSASPQEKVQAFLRFAQDYNVPLQALVASQGQPGAPAQLNPQIALQQYLQQALAPIKNEFQQYKTQQEQAQAAQIAKEIDAFKKDKPHYEALKETMADVLEKGLATDLDGAYSIAMRLPQHDDIWTATQEEKRKAEEAKNAEAARQLAVQSRKKAVSLKSSSPGNAVSEGKKSIRGAYEEQFDAQSGRV